MLDIESKWDRIRWKSIFSSKNEFQNKISAFDIAIVNQNWRLGSFSIINLDTLYDLFDPENITSYLFFVSLCHYLPDLTNDLIYLASWLSDVDFF